jgi:hypothetical protein
MKLDLRVDLAPPYDLDAAEGHVQRALTLGHAMVPPTYSAAPTAPQ